MGGIPGRAGSTGAWLGGALRIAPGSAGQRPDGYDVDHPHQPQHTRRHVRSVKSGEREERGAEQVCPNGESFMNERRELERLESKEGRAGDRSHPEPQLRVAEYSIAPRVLRLFLVLDRGEREHHEQRRHEEHERRCRGHRNVENRFQDVACGRVGPRLVRQPGRQRGPVRDEVRRLSKAGFTFGPCAAGRGA